MQRSSREKNLGSREIRVCFPGSGAVRVLRHARIGYRLQVIHGPLAVAEPTWKLDLANPWRMTIASALSAGAGWSS